MGDLIPVEKVAGGIVESLDMVERGVRIQLKNTTLAKTGLLASLQNHGDSTEAVRVEDIDIIVWNCQGTGHPNFHRFLKEYLREFDPRVVVLVETRVSGVKADKVIKNIGDFNAMLSEDDKQGG
ncbi:hypothetical protein GOBAR_DD18234 [Gossypium barbadense]|nr:hypothetical protein GOBAR_DD18234 [Gossypium barbadense]